MEISRRAGPRCGLCDAPVPAPGARELFDPRCGRCENRPPAYGSLRAAADYTGAAREVLRAFKYLGAEYLAPHLATRMAAARGGGEPPEIVVPVPATSRERRERGHFPAGSLAREIAVRLGARTSDRLLVKTRETRRQALLPLSQRQTNVRGAFAASGGFSRVLLVDDVATSGSTLEACARTLRRAGVRSIEALAFARALPEES
jgi:predicted amidophosphoribosyltransferase